EWLQYDNLSFWWIIYIPLIQKALEITKFIENFSTYLEKNKPKEIVVNRNFSNLSIIKQCAKKYKIKLTVHPIKKLRFNTKKKVNLFLRNSLSYQLTKNKVNQRKKIFLQFKEKIPESNAKLLFVVQPRYSRLIFNPKSNHSEIRDWLAQDIMDLFDKKEIIGIDVFSHIRENDSVLKQRMNSDYAWFPIEMIFGSKSLSTNNKKKFLQRYNNIINDPLFQNQFQINGINFWNQIKEIFNKMKNYYYFPFYIILIDSLNQYFKIHKPKALFLTYEYGQYAVCVISVAKKYGIKTIGIAHSIVYENHYGYSHSNFSTKEKPYDFPLPDHLLLFGKYSEEILLSQGYPTNQLTVFGKSDYFNLEEIKQTLKNKNIHGKYHLPQNCKVILFTSQKFQKNYEEFGAKYQFDSIIWENLLKNFANSESYFLILKPHPREKNVQVYENLIKKYQANNARVIQDDLFELIFISDLVLSFFSNSLLDALCFEKPVIRVKFGSFQHPIFDNSKAILSIPVENLASTIKEVLTNPKIKENLINNARILIKDQLNIPISNPLLILQNILNKK
ncbi:MAG: hypothetical protein ACFFD1_04225, partial [Candidatus Thorarchaeota archaeon]